jgi:hypothetical protein
MQQMMNFCWTEMCQCERTSNWSTKNHYTLLKMMSFATSHYATGMQLVVVCNYFGHVYNYKFGIV